MISEAEALGAELVWGYRFLIFKTEEFDVINRRPNELYFVKPFLKLSREIMEIC